DNLVDRLVRENKVRLKTTTEWRAGFIENVLNPSQCPRMPQERGSDKWSVVTQLLNRTATGWSVVTIPAPALGVIESKTMDNPVAPSPTSWAAQTDFDGVHEGGSANIPGGKTLSYKYDYILDESSYYQPAAVRDWKVVTASSGAVNSCPDVTFLQQRTVMSYQSEPGYPKNSASTLQERADFATSGFTVFDVTANAAIPSISGWYLIPAGHAVVVRKQVTLPTLTLHNDSGVANPGSFTSYAPHLYDNTLTWTIERPITLQVAHDGGEDNLFSMSARQLSAGEGRAEYRLAR
ncbi:MAG: hypothetical protein FD130_1604, partial [Halothiobacillaceae bacterium]